MTVYLAASYRITIPKAYEPLAPAAVETLRTDNSEGTMILVGQRAPGSGA